VLGSANASLLGSGVGSGQLGKAEGLLLEDGADQEGEVGFLGGSEEGHRGVDRGFHAVVPWHRAKPLSVEGYVAVPSYPRRFRSFNHCGGYASERNRLLTCHAN
jgi:hypothetical protein